MNPRAPLRKAIILGLLPLACAFTWSAPGQAADVPTHEVTVGTDSTLSFSGGSTSLGLGASYLYYALPDWGIQVGYDLLLDYLSANNASVTVWSNVFGVRLNLGRDVKLTNQLFVDAGIGFTLRRNSLAEMSDSNTSFLYEAGFGKRFRISDRVAYVPSFSIRKVTDETVRFNFTLIALSVFFD